MNGMNIVPFIWIPRKKQQYVWCTGLLQNKNIIFLDCDLWFLSSPGHDSGTCGCPHANACKTLDQLLTNYYGAKDTKTASNTSWLNIITDKSVRIGPDLVVSFYFLFYNVQEILVSFCLPCQQLW